MTYRSSLLASGVLAMILAPSLAAAAQPVKTARECNSELVANLAAIRAAGESIPAFVHDCWWNSTPGTPTPIARHDPWRPDEPAPRPVAVSHPAVHRVPHALVAAIPVRRHRVTAVKSWSRMRLAHLGPAWARRETRRIARAERTWRWREAARRAGGSWIVAAHPARKLPRIAALAPRRAREAERSVAGSMGQALPAGDAGAEAGTRAPRRGRTIWVKVVEGQARLEPAVLVTPVETASHTAPMNCWGQQVLFQGRAGDRWGQSLVCDDKTPADGASSRQIWFVGPATTR